MDKRSDDKDYAALVTVREDVIRFLLGEAAFDGVWYGDRPHGAPAYWWRNPLRISMQPVAPSAVAPRSNVEHIPEYFAKPRVTEALAEAHPALLVRQMANEILRLRSMPSATLARYLVRSGGECPQDWLCNDIPDVQAALCEALYGDPKSMDADDMHEIGKYLAQVQAMVVSAGETELKYTFEDGWLQIIRINSSDSCSDIPERS